MEYGYIYKITNNTNNKQYIGQTKSTVNERWRKHIDNARNCPDKQVITQAIAKYGVENFSIEEIAKCPMEDLDQWEIYYIKKYDTFQNGYNMTAGGNGAGKSYTEEQLLNIIQLATTGHTNVSRISECVGLSAKIVARLMKKYDIKISYYDRSKGNIDNLRSHWGKHTDNLVKPCPIRIVELDKSFNSMLECAKFLIKNNYTKTNNEIYVMKSISRALADKNYQRKTYLGFHLEKL